MKNEKIKSLKSYHATLAGLSAMGLLAVIFIDNWGDMIMWLPMAIAIFCDGKYEKRDELARLNLYKANTVTMWILFIVLGWFGIITSKGLREKRRVAVVLSFFIAMFLTPPDPMSQFFMALPLCLLYEVSIWLIWLKEKGTFGNRSGAA